jgi:hypothetical protein
VYDAVEQPFKSKDVHAALCQYLRTRPDLGARKAVLDVALEPQNPFEPSAARTPRRWFVLLALIAMLLLASFAYFGNLR